MMVKPDTLERLLIDRSLRAVSPDVGELIAAYLDEHPVQNAVAAEVDQTVALAERCLGRNQPVMLPPFPAQAARRAQQSVRRRALVIRIATVAACMFLGFGAGFL